MSQQLLDMGLSCVSLSLHQADGTSENRNKWLETWICERVLYFAFMLLVICIKIDVNRAVLTCSLCDRNADWTSFWPRVVEFNHLNETFASQLHSRQQSNKNTQSSIIETHSSVIHRITRQNVPLHNLGCLAMKFGEPLKSPLEIGPKDNYSQLQQSKPAVVKVVCFNIW